MQTAALKVSRQAAPLLQFDRCVLPVPAVPGESLDLHASLGPGELVLLYSQDRAYEEALTGAICGMLQPISGTVRFLGADWRGLSPDRANALRGRIGIACRDESWIPYLSILENVILAQLHHTRRPVEAICLEAAQWASRFGLPGMPTGLPAAASTRDRRLACLARAFLGSPSLVLVEHQGSGPDLTPALKGALINAIGEVRRNDGAVLWLSGDRSLILDRTIPATRRLRLEGRALRPLESAG